MTHTQLISAIDRLSVWERLDLVERVLRSIKKAEQKASLAQAAQMMRSEYESNAELTALTTLDVADFYEAK
jgi:hypothetical protein